MVALAAGSSSRSTEISYQTKITTVMLSYRRYFSGMVEKTPRARGMSEKELRARIDRVIAEEERTYGRLLELRDQLEAVIGELESSRALGPTARLPNISNIVAQPSRFRLSKP